ncbi:MAG: DUF6338 family protein [Solirubrobacterales bacterium]
MPASVVAVGLLLTLFVPGYLFQAGVREHNSVLTAERDLYAIAQAVAISAGFLVFLSLLLALGEVVFSGEGLRAELLHDPTAKDHEGLTNAQAVLLLFLLVFPVPIGRFFGRTKTNRENKKEQAEGARGATRSSEQSPSLAARAWAKSWGYFFGPSPMATEVDRIAGKAAREPIYVRIVSQGGEDIVGLMDPEAAEATRSKLGQGLALSARWAPGDDGAAWRQLPGTHIGTAQIVHIFSWGAQQAGTPPVWLERVPRASGAVDGAERAGGLRERLGL